MRLITNSGLGGAKLVQWQDRYYVGASQTIRRIQPSGQQDMSFIEMNLGPYFSSLQGGDYHVYPDGRVLMSGTHTLSDVARGFVGNYNLVWFSNTGYLDTTRVHKRGNGPIYHFGQYADGGFLCSGNASMYEGQPVDRTSFAWIPLGSSIPTSKAMFTWAGPSLSYHYRMAACMQRAPSGARTRHRNRSGWCASCPTVPLIPPGPLRS